MIIKTSVRNQIYKYFLELSKIIGNYSNILLGDSGQGAKITTQRKEINKLLKDNPRNYWVNTAGFERLISDLKQD